MLPEFRSGKTSTFARPAKTEVHRRQLGGADEFREVVARAEPRKDAVAFPAPRDHFFARVIGVKMPAMLLCIFFNALMQPVVIPAQREQHAFLFSGHEQRK